MDYPVENLKAWLFAAQRDLLFSVAIGAFHRITQRSIAEGKGFTPGKLTLCG
jgi:hypothetical protein